MMVVFWTITSIATGSSIEGSTITSVATKEAEGPPRQEKKIEFWQDGMVDTPENDQATPMCKTFTDGVNTDP